MRKKSPRNYFFAIGFTLVELMVTIAVLAVLVAIALPDLRTFLVNSKLSSNTNEFIGLLNYARSEAISRNQVVSVCSRIAATGRCSTNGFWAEREVQVFVDQDGDGDKDSAEEVLKIMAAQDADQTQFRFTRQNASTSAKTVSFLPAGYVRAKNKFLIHAIGNATYETKYGRLVCISSAGRARAAPADSTDCP
jgi:type IV fimbrial biogenesis protein FimT